MHSNDLCYSQSKLIFLTSGFESDVIKICIVMIVCYLNLYMSSLIHKLSIHLEPTNSMHFSQLQKRIKQHGNGLFLRE